MYNRVLNFTLSCESTGVWWVIYKMSQGIKGHLEDSNFDLCNMKQQNI